MASRNTRAGKEDASFKMGDNLSGGKRLAEDSPEKQALKKRTAFVDLTNAVSSQVVALKKQVLVGKKQDKKHSQKQRITKDAKPVLSKSSEVERSSDDWLKSSQESASTDDDSKVSSQNSLPQSPDASSTDDLAEKVEADLGSRVLPPGVDDYDKECLEDPFSEPRYAMDIFEYYKSREGKFQLDFYMSRQDGLSKGMRAVLVDWLVEVQESFELNHETLYLAVKFVDHYLMRKVLPKTSLQLLGATAIFIACKFDERSPPIVDDFLYICDDAYTRKQLLHMEIEIIKTLNFDIGIPLSYRFLRRFARCAKVSMEILTLARYILETSLMEYEMIIEADSKMAAAALHLALRMKGDAPQWTPSMEYYSGYRVEEILDLERRLNLMVSQPTYKSLTTVKTKYSHSVFLEVAKIPSLPID